MAFQIDEIRLRQVAMPLVKFFETSFGRTYERHMVLVSKNFTSGIATWRKRTSSI